MLKLILFDLDGTLSDSGPGIIRSVRYALDKCGITEEREAVLRSFVGPPLLRAFAEVYGFTKEQSLQALTYYREVYWTSGIYDNAPYPGVAEGLKALKAKGYLLAVATGKPTPMAEEVLRYFGWTDLFDHVSGASLDESRVEKEELIRIAMEALGITDPAEALMVGDRGSDILGAKALGVPTVGVLYGYGTREELEAAGPDRLIGSFAELPELL